MNFDQHIARYLGTYLADYGGQCVSNAAHYCLDNGKPIAYANACDWWKHSALTGAFDFITNVPTDYNQVPNRGDIIIWNSALAGSGGAGHIAIYDAKVSPGVFRSLDSNWGGATVHFVNHNYNNVIGWMRPKAVAPTQGSGSIMDTDDKIKRQYNTLRGSEGTPGERAAWLGKPYDQFNQTAVPEINSREQDKRNTQVQIASLTKTNNELSVTLTNALADDAADEKALKDALAEASRLQTELTTAMDKLKEAQTKPTVPPQDTISETRMKQFVKWVRELLGIKD